ncbi:MAG TPA: CHASE3 domain-containing protein [Opitutaceae bacterium]|nr:CHASE3 domain-containing protein [Opitutaceae bacterium]
MDAAHRPRTQRLFILVTCVPLVLFLAASILAFSSGKDLPKSFQRISHHLEVNQTISDLTMDLVECENLQRGYLLTGQEDYFQTFREAQRRVAERLEKVAKLTNGNSDQERLVTELRPLVHETLLVFSTDIALKSSGKNKEAQELFGSRQGERSMDQIGDLTARLNASSGILLLQQEAAGRKHMTRISVFYGVLVLIDLMVVTVFWWLMLRLQNLERFVTVCAWSKTIKYNDRWLSFEEYLRDRFGVTITHGISEKAAEKILAGKSEEEPATAGLAGGSHPAIHQ